jgi:RNA polymerase sigma-70 factor, ECF subfamily
MDDVRADTNFDVKPLAVDTEALRESSRQLRAARFTAGFREKIGPPAAPGAGVGRAIAHMRTQQAECPPEVAQWATDSRGQYSDETPIETLLGAVVAGRRAAFSELYRRTSGSVFRSANALLRCDEDAQEIVADVYLHVWSHAERYDPLRGPVAVWLANVARHKAIDRYRCRCRRVGRGDEQGAGTAVIGETLAVEEEVLRVESNRELHGALRSLQPLRRRMIGLSFFRGMSHREIADELEIPLGSVKSHIRRGLISLKLILKHPSSPGSPSV